MFPVKPVLQAGLLVHAGVSPQGISSPLEAAGWPLECQSYLCQAPWYLEASKSLGTFRRRLQAVYLQGGPRDVWRGGRSSTEQWAVLVGGKRG